MVKRYVNIPDHTFCRLIDLIGVMASYIPDVPPFIRDGVDNHLRDILKEVDYEWKEQNHDYEMIININPPTGFSSDKDGET